MNKIVKHFLEAKLAESEADKKALISDYESRITKHQELMSWLEHNNEELKQQLAEKEKEIEHWHNLYKNRDQQFQSVRQRYHLLNKLQSNYDKKDKLHLAYMQCKELVDENEKLKQQLHDLPKKIVGDIEKNFTEYLPLKDKTGAGFYSRLNTILKKYGGEDESLCCNVKQ